VLQQPGNAYRDKGDSDHGIADYNQAMRLDPKGALVYYNQGNAYCDSRGRKSSRTRLLPSNSTISSKMDVG
jgi:tetratricopeptide (TPR) repeat protein